MKSLPRFSVENPVLVNLFMATILVGGTYSGFTLVREMFPESRPSRVLITTTYPGATPADVEKGITLKIEEQIKDIDGVDKIRSTITEGESVILVEMVSGFDDIDQAVNDVKAAIDSIPPEDFPEEALESNVSKFEPRFPVIRVSLFGDLGDRALKTLGERLRDDLLALPGITNVSLSGTRKDEISVEVRPGRLVKFGLSFADVSDAIAQSNLDLPGGLLRTSTANISVRTLGEKDRGEELYDIVVRSDPSGRVIHLRDVATIVDGFEDVELGGHFNGSPAVSATVFKTADQDAIEIAALVRAIVAGKMGRPLERAWLEGLVARFSSRDVVREVYERAASDPYPPSIGVATHTDLSRFIEGRLDLLTRNGAWGLLLVFLSLLAFLHWRVAFWVMMGLVLAIMGSLIVMRLVGQTLNLITMLGLIIVLGLLVDDAIIVSEHVYSKVEAGVQPKPAAIAGTEEVTWPVVCAILTTIVAFVPLTFIEGQMGDWMSVLPVVVCVALSVSLVEALTILPSHLAHGLRPLRAKNEDPSVPRGALRTWIARLRGADGGILMPRLRRLYERVLRRATGYRYVTMAALLGAVLVVAGVVAGDHVPFVFLQKIDSETVIANLKMSVGTPVSKTREAIQAIERATLGLSERKTVLTLFGSQESTDGGLSTTQSHLGQMFLELLASDQRGRTSDEIVQQLRTDTTDIPGVDKLRYTTVSGGPGGAPIHLEISGDRPEDLTEVSKEFQARLAGFDGVFDIVDDFDAGRPEVQIELFESARALGLTTQSLATQVRSAFYGVEARKVQRRREDVKIMVRYPPDYRRRIHDIEMLRVATPSGQLVPFTEVARLTEGSGYASIKRTDQRRTVTVTADVDTNVSNSHRVIADLTGYFPDILRRYPGVQLAFGGQKLETTKSFGSLKHSFVIALLLIYVILAGLFRSYIQPAIVMAVIPFGLIGAVAGHFVMGYPLTILSMIGTVALTGIVVNDSMILVTFINHRVRDGVPIHEAVIQGGRSRLRPILLTSATTVLGIAPLMMETSFQAKFMIPMGVSISAGLIFATVLTLVAIPCMYLIVNDFEQIAAWVWRILLGIPCPVSSITR